MVDRYFCVKCGESGTPEVIVGHKCKEPVPTAANLTLRDYFAGQALTGMMASRSPTSPRFHPDDDAQYVYAVADAMLEAREVLNGN